MGRKLALLVATYEYQDTGLSRLTSPAHDIEALAAVLQEPTIAGFEVTTLINEPYSGVGRAIGDLYRGRRRDDLTLLYFTGHGLKDDAGRLYLAMTDTKRDSLIFSGLSDNHIDQMMDSSVQHQQVLVLDCCFSGSYMTRRGVKGDDAVHALSKLGGRGRAVLTASDALQYAFEGEQLSGTAAQSLFTRFIVEGIREGSADTDGDGEISLDELYAFVHDNVVRLAPNQRPKKKEDISGRIFIARNIHWTIPEYVLIGLNNPIVEARHGALQTMIHMYRSGNEFVRSIVLKRIEGLLKDDSKSVSGDAQQFLTSLTPPSSSTDLPQVHWFRHANERWVVGDEGRQPLVRPVPAGAFKKPPPDFVIDGVDIGSLTFRAASVRGITHQERGEPRQDAYAVRFTQNQGWLVGCIADGVASAPRSHEAAAIVVDRLTEELVSNLAANPVLDRPGDWSQVSNELPWTAVVETASQEIGRFARDYIRRIYQIRGEIERLRELEKDFTYAEARAVMATTAMAFVIATTPSADGTYRALLANIAGDSSALLLQDGTWRTMQDIKTDGREVLSGPTKVLPGTTEVQVSAFHLPAGCAFVVMTDGLGDPLGSARGTVGTFLRQKWQIPPDPLAFAQHLSFYKKAFTDDRTAVMVWTSPARNT